VKAVREALGPGIRVMIDANGAWDVPTAVTMGRAAEPFDIYWYEEPVCPDDLRGSAEVAKKVAVAVAGYETCTYGRIGFRDYIQAEAIHFVQPDVAWAGGLTECVKIAHGAGVECATGAIHPRLCGRRRGGRAPLGGDPERPHGGNGLPGASVDGGAGEGSAPCRSDRSHRAQRAARLGH